MSAIKARKSAKADLRWGPSCDSALDSRFRGNEREKSRVRFSRIQLSNSLRAAALPASRHA